MDEEATDFYVTLSSKAKSYGFVNTPANFKISYRQDIKLADGKWKVALHRLIYKRSWHNLTDDKGMLILFHPDARGSENIHLNSMGYEKAAGELLHTKLSGTTSDPEKSKYLMTGIKLRPGYYENPGDILGRIARDYMHLREPYEKCGMPLYWQYEKNQKTISMHGPAGFLFVDANPFLKALGLENDVHNIDDTHKFVIGNLFGRNGKIPKVIDTMYIYSDLVDVNIVGDEKVNFVTVVPVEGEHGSTVHYAPTKPEYKKVMHNTIKSIELQLSDCFGDNIAFDASSETIAIFHFKKFETLD